MSVIQVTPDQISDSGDSKFTNLYRMLDLEREAEEEAQRLSMPAAFEILAAYEDDEWRRDKQEEWQAYVDQHGHQPQWSASSSRSFAKWVQERAERDGHSFTTGRTIEHLRDAALCQREVRGATQGRTLPENEKAWRPAVKLLKLGYRKQITDVLDRATEIAEEEGGPVTYGRMLAARTEVMKTDPEIQSRNTHPDQATERDKAKRFRHQAETAIKDLWRTGQRDEMDGFAGWVTEWLRNWEAVK